MTIETEKALRKIQKGSDYRNDEENRDYVDRLQADFEKAISRKAFLDQDYVKEMVLKIKSILGDIRRQLVEEDDQMERVRLKADREAYQKIFSWLAKDIDAELSEINEKVNEILEKA